MLFMKLALLFLLSLSPVPEPKHGSRVRPPRCGMHRTIDGEPVC